MIPILRHRSRPIVAICASLFLPTLCGCQGHKIIARINGEAITDEQFVTRLERVVPQEYDPMVKSNRAGLNIDAGAVALVTAIREKAVEILAKQKNAVPSNETVDAIYAFQKLSDPNIAMLIKNNMLTEEDLKHNIRIQAEAVGIGTDGAHVEAKEVSDAFSAAQKSPVPAERLDITEKYGMRLLRVKDMSDGQMVLNRLKPSGDFATEARLEGDQTPLDGSERIIPVYDIQRQLPLLYDTLKPLSPGEFAPAPITLTSTGANGTQSFVAVVQLTKKLPAHQVKLEEVQAELTQRLLQKKFAQWQFHFLQTLNDFLRNKDTTIEIDIDRYKPLIAGFLRTPPESATAPAGMGAGPDGAPAPAPGNEAPGGPGTGATPSGRKP